MFKGRFEEIFSESDPGGKQAKSGTKPAKKETDTMYSVIIV